MCGSGYWIINITVRRWQYDALQGQCFGLVVRCQLRRRRVPGSKPDSTVDIRICAPASRQIILRGSNIVPLLLRTFREGLCEHCCLHNEPNRYSCCHGIRHWA
ncbi:hypothetical protein AVEN_101255-1 [Araneus ventricosus]|uniref:Uncharacterized protein n=1 Tax=Araneus ventricosus TaxID=182803 RepID=A0A4Y2M5K3_ARAVE|nr:hypothetical protein AVEN_101255-1 [Araneus ventricosus]